MIVILLTACITVGIGLASKTFNRTYNYSKAQTLASTLNYLISDELRTAWSVQKDPDTGEWVYRSENYVGTYGDNGCVYMKVDDGKILVDTGDTSDEYHNNVLYTFGAPSLYGEHLEVEEETFNIDIQNGVFKIHYEIVDKNNPNTPLVTSDFEVKSMEKAPPPVVE